MSAIIEKYATLSNVLRPSCRVDYVTPVGTPTGMPVNCAVSNTTGWPWQYYEVITMPDAFGTTSTYKQCDPNGDPQNSPVEIVETVLGETHPIYLVDGYEERPTSLAQPAIKFGVNGTDVYARGMFGYIATHPIPFQVYISANITYGYPYDNPYGDRKIISVIGPKVRLFKQDGTLVTLTNNGTSEQTYPLTSYYKKDLTSQLKPLGYAEDRLYIFDNILPATSCPLFLHFGCTAFGDYGAAEGQYDPSPTQLYVGFKAQPL